MTEIAVKLKLSDEVSERLARQASETGQDLSVIASNLIEQAVGGARNVDSSTQLAAIESFIKGMTDWTSKHVPPGDLADDNRESIYGEDRGG
jgi:predicted transcriptional regulator